MTTNLEQRACALAVYMIETGATVRKAAEQFGISKIHRAQNPDPTSAAMQLPAVSAGSENSGQE